MTYFSSFYGVGSLRIESAGIELHSLVPAGTVAGVAILHAAGRNGPGLGRLRVSAAGDTIQWRAPGSATWGAAVAIPVSDAYLLSDGADPNKWLRVQVWTDHVIAADEAVVALRDVFNNGLGHLDVTANQAAAGDVALWELTLRNIGSHAIVALIAWLDPATPGLEISANGITWQSPTGQATAMPLADLAPAAAATLYLRRTIAALAAFDSDVLNHLHFSFRV